MHLLEAISARHSLRNYLDREFPAGYGYGEGSVSIYIRIRSIKKW